MSRHVIPIVYATNDKYAPYATVSIASLVENSSKDYFYNIHVFHTGLEEKTLDILNSMKGENYKVETLAVGHYIEEEMKLMYTTKYFTKEMFYRILIPDVLPNYSKAIYLDCDTVVLKDISELYNYDLEGYTIAAVSDAIEFGNDNWKYVTEELGLQPAEYINSGVLLINCDRFRQLKMKEKCFQELAKRKNLLYPDQEVINFACEGEKKIIEKKWNYNWIFEPEEELNRILNLIKTDKKKRIRDIGDIGVLHFLSPIKPWNNRVYPLAEYFWEYVPLSPFAKSIEDEWKTIPKNSFISYRFMDFDDKGIVLTVALQDELGIGGDIVVKADGYELTTKQTFKSIEKIEENRYGSAYFETFVPYELLTQSRKITFYDQLSGEQLETSSRAPFPADFKTGAFFSNGRYIIYALDNSLVLAPFSGKLLAEQKKYHRRKRKEFLAGLNEDKVELKATCLRIMYCCLKPFFKKELWFISDRLEAGGGNGQALFEYLARNPLDHVKCYFVVDKNSEDYKTLGKIGKVISPNSRRYQIYSLFATRNISTRFSSAIMRPIYCQNRINDILFKCKTIILHHGFIKEDNSLVYNRYENMAVVGTAEKIKHEDCKRIVDEILNI